ncbi:amidohydrolase family protein [Actinotignum timonense]|uniref:amidohydrolase family protein n=1 Tax=Actinotignum timonense TaxID=1870995 RepID=UPI00254EDAA5|nr:amidohydrolase family protein [Actinotignum timonense]
MELYTGPVIDAHHHFWEPHLGYQPWLRPDAHIPFRYGNYDPIKVDFLPADLTDLAASINLNLVGSVTMETEWELDDPVGEMRYTQNIADRFGLPNAGVGHAILKDPQVQGTLEELAEIPIVRGVRNKPGQSDSPVSAESNPSLLTDPQWQKGYAALRAVGFSFDLQVAWWHMTEAKTVLEQNPDIPLIINHSGLPADRHPDMIAGWVRALDFMAQYPQVSIKISGIGLKVQPWTVENNRPIVERITEIFGTERIMFASNFPVDSIAGSFADIWNGFREITSGWSQAEQRAAYAENAVRIYRLPQDLLNTTSEAVRTAAHAEK